mmetsp:Transcript_32/g.52  ORF Transcript_32/g.52 Transcript_32/m.52 type:complete len:228 (-) Transcript_32:38-721(-)|eukprot:CAMPEP_0196821866 /NCGR_PEP_ID=MMETSP1362-20130617/81287_1 /TAXON_ID=163516 /ORGANISM="Leptocylindrus danicus, Strain CCMP1856" /LENGTH=227 /DNA_ID=CAMNT_0042201231 /DNA_START=40 /DNA_END=723 /DNA_ORIENTATION=+
MGKQALNVEFGEITEENINELKKLNESCFPVSYNASFYKEVASAQHIPQLSKFAYYNNQVVGAICTRVERNIQFQATRLYIMTLGVYAAYRGRCIGTQLLESVLKYVEQAQAERASNSNVVVDEMDEMDVNGKHDEQHERSSSGDALMKHVDEIYLHVQTNNVDAMQFYRRFGFEIGEKIVGYYRRIDPPDCYVIYKKFRNGEEHDNYCSEGFSIEEITGGVGGEAT